MSKERGAANIRKFNADREAKNMALVEYELQLSKRRKLEFRSPGLLAAHLSDRTHIHRTSLIRNPKYKALIALYIKSQPGAASVVSDATDDVDVLRAKLALAQAEIGTLRQDCKRLSARLRRVEEGATPSADSRGVDQADLYMLLSLVIQRADIFAIDRKKRLVIDLSARPSDAIVAGPERAGAFVSWVDRNSELPVVKGLRRAG